MGPDDVTAEWMSGVLGADVGSVASERIGDGLVGLNLRVRLSGADGVPSSVVLKLPSLDETSRATGVGLRNYEREVKFYLHLAGTVDIRVPYCYHGDWDEESGDFVLVLEDMAPAEQGDQLTGCSVDQAVVVIDELAKLHGPRWDDDTLTDVDWLGRRTDEDVTNLVGLWAMFLPGFRATYDRYLGADAVRLLEAFGPRFAEWVGERTGPLAVTHGDFRLDNLLFGTAAGGPPVTTVDWQTPGHGTPVTDLAYFCGAGLVPEVRIDHDRVLVERYATALADYGIEVDRSWLWTQYCRDAFAGVVMAVIASQVVGSSERSEALFATMATRHLQHALDLNSIDLV